MNLTKPQKLSPGDTACIVSLSSGMGGEALFRHRYELGKSRLETEFGLRVVTMPNALKGIDYLDKHPEARAEDFMQAFADGSIKAIFSMIGGDDTIRLLSFIDYSVIRNNPKIFMGYSDTTINHFMLYKAGLVSFYGPCVLAEFAENHAMHEYTKHYIRANLFGPGGEAGSKPSGALAIDPSPFWTSEFLDWTNEANDNIPRRMVKDEKGFELLQGSGAAQGALLGGCLDVFPMMTGTEIWPAPEEWAGKILFLEPSEESLAPITLKYLLRGLAAQGILTRINGILFGKPLGEKYYGEYKEVLLQVLANECVRPDVPILYNVNFGHTAPMCVLPYGVQAEIDCARRSLRLLESGVV